MSYLAVQRHVTAATQNQALHALVFSIGMYWEKLYRSAGPIGMRAGF
ncbi:hypothetical protein [Chromohalobacter moromii]